MVTSTHAKFDGTLDNVVACAKKYIGTKYSYGECGPEGMDCSCLMKVCFEENGISLERMTVNQAKDGIDVKESDLKKGDLVFFDMNDHGVIDHVGLVTENVNGAIIFIHASSSRGVIEVLLSDFWKSKYKKGVRVYLPEANPPTPVL